MTVLLAALTLGLILSLLGLGVLFSFRIVAFRDLTVDGSFTLGGAVSAALVTLRCDPWVATLLAAGAGAAAGSITGLLATRFKINGLLAGILVMTALFTVNLRVMGRATVPLYETPTVYKDVQFGQGSVRFPVGPWEVSVKHLTALLLSAAVAAAAGAAAFAFLRSHLGLAMCATGDNPDMIRALGVNVGGMTTCGLAISNGLIALAGSLWAQHEGFADAQMGIGMVVIGFASVIIGESLVGSRKVGWLIVGAVMGSLVFRLLIAIALRCGLEPNDLKLGTALFVLAALILPGAIAAAKARLAPPAGPGGPLLSHPPERPPAP